MLSGVLGAWNLPESLFSWLVNKEREGERGRGRGVGVEREERNRG